MLDSLFRLPKPIPHAAVCIRCRVGGKGQRDGAKITIVKPKTDCGRVVWLSKGVYMWSSHHGAIQPKLDCIKTEADLKVYLKVEVHHLHAHMHHAHT